MNNVIDNSLSNLSKFLAGERVVSAPCGGAQLLPCTQDGARGAFFHREGPTLRRGRHQHWQCPLARFKASNGWMKDGVLTPTPKHHFSKTRKSWILIS